MLPMQGLFRALSCPYYVAGLCERPHCLFRHTKSDQSTDESSSNPVPNSSDVTKSKKTKTKASSRGVKRKAQESHEELDNKKRCSASKKQGISTKPKCDEENPSIKSQGDETEISSAVSTKSLNVEHVKCDLQDTNMNFSEMDYSGGGCISDGDNIELSDYEDDPDDVELECLRLFENYKPEEKPPDPEIVILNSFEKEDCSAAGGRKRQAHAAGIERKVQPKAKGFSTSQNLKSVVAKRLESQKEALGGTMEQEHGSIKSVSDSSTKHKISSINGHSAATNVKKRISHVSNVIGLLRSPPKSSTSDTSSKAKTGSTGPCTSTKVNDQDSKTIPKTALKGTNRQAHLPSKCPSKEKRPNVSIDSPSKGSGKIPIVNRQRVMDQLFEAALQIYDNSEDAFTRAVEEENTLESRSKTKQVYMSLAISRICVIRKEVGQVRQQGATSRPSSGVVRPSLPGTGSTNNPVRAAAFKLSGNSLYKSLKSLMLSEEQLVSNGLPRPHPSGEPGRAVAEFTFWNDNYISESTRRTCDRCKKVYIVSESGQQVHEDKCIFHPGKRTMNRVNRVWIASHDCCGEERGSNGCTSLDYHVPKGHPVSITKGFVTAVQSAGVEDKMGLDPWDIVALDCEMVYTTGGNQLARATFVGSDGKVLYDQVVKPSHPILDYNTQFSGLTPEIMSQAKCSLVDVQAVILTHLKKNSILIGHSLESDLIALRLVHDYIVDTSILYPHKRGPPYKRALRTLSSEHLRKIIQESIGGHDSAEDARIALELVLKFLETTPPTTS